MIEGKLPSQLPWRRFVCVLSKLGYKPMKSGHGSARAFYSPSREPAVATFHEPHGKDSLREGTLREYIRKLRLTREEFLAFLERC
jgi:predicted RNA binding protein YcfA (HicA-like mRNA interferase family)